MFDDHHWNVHGLPDVDDKAGHVLLFLQIHPGQRLVHEQDLGFHGQGPTEVDPLAESIAEGPDDPVPDMLDLQEIDDLLHLFPLPHLLPVGPGPVEKPLDGIGLHVDMAAREEVVDDTQAGKELDPLKGPSDPEFGPLVLLEMGDVLIVKEDLSPLRVIESVQAVQEAGLSRTVWTDDRQDFTRSHVDIDLREGLHALEPEGDVHSPHEMAIAFHIVPFSVIVGNVD